MNLLAAIWLVLFSAAVEDPGLAAKLEALTAPELAGRGAATEGERQAANLMASWLSDAGCRPAFDDGGWLQKVPLPDGRNAVNVVGVLVGAGDLVDRWLVVGAHIDHLGRVDPTIAGVPAPGEYYPGAGDNASGVVSVVAAVTRFAADQIEPRRSLLICGFGAEEIGLLGSAHLAGNLPVPPGHIDAMINLDAVGRLGEGPLNVAGLETSPRFQSFVEAAASPIAVRPQNTSLLQSDHLNFIDLGIPSLFLFTGGYAEMNSPADDFAHLDLRGVETVAAITGRLVASLATARDTFEFRQPPPASRPEAGSGNRETWFGSVPDFADEGADGYVIGGVADGGPAARAGLQKGDVLIILGGEPVADLATFTTALRHNDPGDVVEVEVLREGRRIRSLVTLGDRSERDR